MCAGAAGPVQLAEDTMETENDVADAPAEEDALELRNYFPETWLWDLYDVG